MDSTLKLGYLKKLLHSYTLGHWTFRRESNRDRSLSNIEFHGRFAPETPVDNTPTNIDAS